MRPDKYKQKVAAGPTPTRMAITKNKTGKNKCGWGCGKTGTLIHCWWEYKKLQLLWKTVCQLFKKLHRELPYEPAHKKEWSNDSWHNRDEPWKHTKWKNIKGHILHDSIYMKYPENAYPQRWTQINDCQELGEEGSEKWLLNVGDFLLEEWKYSGTG